MLARWLLPYVETPTALDRYVGASQIGITLSSLILGAYAQATVSVRLAPNLAAVARSGTGDRVRRQPRFSS